MKKITNILILLLVNLMALVTHASICSEYAFDLSGRNGFLHSNPAQVYQLCGPSQSIAPVDCYFETIKQSNNGYAANNKVEVVRLCRLADSNGPSNCYTDAVKRSYRGYLRDGQYLAINKNEAITLCSRARDNSPVDCYYDQVAGGAHLTNAVRNCSLR